jgi:hypothetical protein
MYNDHTNLNALRFYLKVLNYVTTLMESVDTRNSDILPKDILVAETIVNKDKDIQSSESHT